MTTTTIYFIRHGEVENPQEVIYGRVLDVHLSKTGVKGMAELARRLWSKGIRPDVIYTSPLSRAYQSAQAMAKMYGGVPIKKHGGFLEVDSQGLAGRPISFIQAIGGDAYNYPKKDYSSEEPEEIAERMVKATREIRQNHDGQTIFVVSHGDPLAFAIWRLLHPLGRLPSIVTLHQQGYFLKKGQARRVVFDEKGKIAEHC